MPETFNEKWSLGIDFGTSTTFAAYSSSLDSATISVRLSHDAATMPSSVFVESPERVDVGDVAIDKSRGNPTGFLSVPKRTIANGTAHVNGYDIPASVPIAAIFQTVIERASREHNGSPPENLVITHPESWSDNEVQVLLDSAAAVGFDDAHVTAVSEARAAAHYYTRAKNLRPGSKIAVFDYGGGTLDVAVMSMNDDGSFQVLAADGDVNNGGRYLDSLIRGWVDEQLSTAHPEVLTFLRGSARVEQHYALADSITRAKALLSEARTARVLVPAADGHVSLDLSRGELERIIDAPLRHAQDMTAAILQRAGVSSPYDLEALYLTGGSSRIPLVAERLAALGPVTTLDDPKAVVALGALTATQAVAKAQHLSGYSSGAGVYQGPGGSPHTRPALAQDGSGGTGKPGRGKLIVGVSVIAVIVLALGGLAWRQLGGGDGDTSPAPAKEPATVAEREGPASTKDDVLAALPAQFANDLSDCEVTGETTYGGIEMICDLSENATSIEGMDSTFSPSLTISADPDYTASEIAALRKGLREDSMADSNELVENNDRTAAAVISGSQSSTTVRYSSTESDVTLRVSSLESPEAAKEFLDRSGLLSS